VDEGFAQTDATDSINSTTPRLMPERCGSVRRKPKFTPEASSIVLLGPGVMLVTSANRMPAGSALRVRSDMMAPVSAARRWSSF